jgi:hypothetical protein
LYPQDKYNSPFLFGLAFWAYAENPDKIRTRVKKEKEALITRIFFI